MRDGFSIDISSDLDYEEMVAYIYWGNSHIATVDYEKGLDNMEIELFNRRGKNASWNFPIDSFLDALQESQKVLLKMQKRVELEESEVADSIETY